MELVTRAREVIRVLREIAEVGPLLSYKQAKDEALISLGSVFEDAVEKFGDNTVLLFEGRQWSYRELNGEVNQLAHYLKKSGVNRGDCVALFMENRAEFAISLLALVKLGATASLINNSLSGAALVHCIQITGAVRCLVGEERVEVLAAVQQDLDLEPGQHYLWMRDSGAQSAPDWAQDATAGMAGMAATNLPETRQITAGEAALYIFTSGTTGLPKAAIMRHRKIIAAGEGLGQAGFRTRPEDRLYLCLPLYHITGLGPGFFGFVTAGASVFLRRSFSASRFWSEVQQHRTNSFIYVGELCRYLLMRAEAPEEHNNPLIKMMGNGLRPDVWDEFKSRFQIERISEIYGSSEGNVTFLNLLNKNRTIGAAGMTIALVKYDLESDTIVRDQRGRCVEVALGEPGLLLGEINAKAQFDGYTNVEATDGKIVRDAKKIGDCWFNTGDLVRQIDVGFALGLKHFQFVDRVGDTFRWRAENVSTNDVAEVLNGHAQIDMANVYGVEVPGVEGRAGMVAFELDPDAELDVTSLLALVEKELPPYAQPVFIRILRSAETTVTFKLLKGALREQAFHLDQVGDDPIYVRRPRGAGYEKLEPGFYRQLLDGKAGY